MAQKNPLNERRRTHNLDFFRGFLRQPASVGSVMPSSRFLEQRIIRAAALETAGLVVELGPGTGGTTRSFLNSLSPGARLLTIEISREFVAVLDRIEDPRLINHCGNALDLQSILQSHTLSAPDAIISGIPFSSLSAKVGRHILANVWQSLAADGRFVAYQFRGHVAELAKPLLGPPETVVEVRNIPPMRVFRWQRCVNGHDPSFSNVSDNDHTAHYRNRGLPADTMDMYSGLA